MDYKEAYEKLIREFFDIGKPVRGIEIGCFKGEFDAYLLKQFPTLRIFTIDPCAWWPEVLKNNNAFLDRLYIIPLTSDMAIDHMSGIYDFIFIDGEHNYEQCRKDIINYMKLIKPGGLISGHNCESWEHCSHPGVYRAVKEIFGDKFKTGEDTIWYVQKQE